AGGNGRGEIEELREVEVVRRRERRESKAQERARSQRVRGVQRKVAMHGLGVRIAPEVLDGSEVTGEDAVGAQPLEAPGVAFLAGFLHAWGGDDDAHAAGASPFDGYAETHHLHEVEL